MFIVPNQSSKPPIPVAPEGWSPIVFERANLIFEANPELIKYLL